MTKSMKKFAVITVSFVMMMAMSISSFAANPQSGDTFTISKTLYVVNPTLSSVDGPGLTYEYTIDPVTPDSDNGGTTITDGTHTSTVKPGVAGVLTFSNDTISWPIGTAVDADSGDGAANTKSISITADPENLNSAGIYRYEITEECTERGTADYSALSNYDIITLYIDVYVVNGNSGLEISGLVMHDGTTSSGAPAEKTVFPDEKFYTTNVFISQSVEGSMGDKGNEFPFDITVSDSGRYYYETEGWPYYPPSESDLTINTTGSTSTELMSGSAFWLCGVSENTATISATETNNTQDTYSMSYTGQDAINVAPNGTITMSDMYVYAESSYGMAIEFVSSLDAVSPTGVVMRFGAPLLVLAAAAALVLMNRKSKKANSTK